MAWTAPRTWVVGELVTAAFMNTHVRDNDIYLRAEACILWTPVTAVNTGAGPDLLAYSSFPVGRLAAAGDVAYASFRCPDGFVSITKSVMVVIPRVTDVAANWDINTTFAADGEPYNTHAVNDAATTYNVTNNQIYEVDYSTILAAMLAGDYVGVALLLSDNNDDVDVVGFYLEYASV